MNEQQQPTPETIVTDCMSLGRSWANYGLVVSKLAVEQSARSLEHTATILDNAARVINDLRQSLRADTTE